MRLPIENDLQVKMSEALAGIHAQLRFALTLAHDKAARLAALDGKPALAFKLAHSAGWLLIDEQSSTVARTNGPRHPERPYTALSQSQAVTKIVQKSASWSKTDTLAERAMQGILANDRAAFQNLLALAPLVETQVYSFAARLIEILDALRPRAQTAIATDGHSGALGPYYWRFAGMLGRATLLATTPGASLWLLATARSFTWATWTPSFPLVRERNCWLAAIGARAAAEFGPDIVPYYADALRRARHPLAAADAILGMTAIAYRHETVRDAVLDTFRASRSTQPYSDMMAPELLPLIIQQGEALLLSQNKPVAGRPFPLPPYRIDPTRFDPFNGYVLFAQLPLALATPTASLIPGAGAEPVLPTKANADTMLARSWGPEPVWDQPKPRFH